MLHKLNILFLLLLVASCRSSKTNCDAYGSNVILIDTVAIETEHINWNSQCSESVMITEVYIDTLNLKFN